MKFEGTFKIPLSIEEREPVAPFELTVNLAGAMANIANIKTEKVLEERGHLTAKITITKGTALSDEFWEANGKKICDFIHNKISCYGNE